jgi:hypothetical protein
LATGNTGGAGHGYGFTGEEVAELDRPLIVEGHREPAADLAAAPAGVETVGESVREDLQAAEAEEGEPAAGSWATEE